MNFKHAQVYGGVSESKWQALFQRKTALEFECVCKYFRHVNAKQEARWGRGLIGTRVEMEIVVPWDIRDSMTFTIFKPFNMELGEK